MASEALLQILIENIVFYVDELKAFSNDDLDYYIINIQYKNIEINKYIKTSVNFEIVPTSPVFEYTKTFDIINKHKKDFIDNIFRLIQKYAKGYRVQTVNIDITEFRLIITFVLINH